MTKPLTQQISNNVAIQKARSTLVQTKEQKEAERKTFEEGLPHLYYWKWYAWARAYFNSVNKMCLVCAGNQSTKSSSQIRKCIEWAGNPKRWEKLWPGRTPRQFWYMYPSAAVATAEFKLKWVPEFMPRNEFKDHKTYGWKEFYDKEKNIERIEFKSGVTVFFKFYTQNVQNLQTGTVDAIFCDEELPEHLYSELNARLFATNGYFSLVFTATLGQAMWLRAVEGKGDSELFPNAHKMQVSMYDCITYDDGTPGHYSEERIAEIKASCKSQEEVDRRVYGKFVTKGGRKFHGFNAAKHYIKQLPGDFSTWPIAVAVDGGSGGEAHAPAISFMRVRPDNRLGIVYKAWKGDDGPTYTAGDVYLKYVELRGFETPMFKVYDQSYKDFGTIAERQGDTFFKADKSQDRGTDVTNTLFKNDMLYLLADDDEIAKLGSELTALMKATDKTHAVDDLADTLRYNVMSVFWDMPAEKPSEAKVAPVKVLTEKDRIAQELDERRAAFIDPQKRDDSWGELEDELRFWNDQY